MAAAAAAATSSISHASITKTLAPASKTSGSTLMDDGDAVVLAHSRARQYPLRPSESLLFLWTSKLLFLRRRRSLLLDTMRFYFELSFALLWISSLMLKIMFVLEMIELELQDLKL